jgi:hypothetical protein
MTALAGVTVSRDDVLAVCRAAVDDKAQLSADTAASVAALIARCAGPARDQFRDQPGLQLILAMIGVVRERITELANANPSAAFDQHQAELAELAARTISWGRLWLTPAAERVLLISVRSVLSRAAGLP